MIYVPRPSNQEIIKQLKRHLKQWNPKICPYHRDPAYAHNGDTIYHLHLCGLGLKEVPSEVWSLTDVGSLYLMNNQLSTLPAEVGSLTLRRGLYLSHNQLSTLPEEMCYIGGMEDLYLSDNQLSVLPAEIGRLGKLERLDLSHNQFSTLPAGVSNLTMLQVLDLSNNQFSTLPAGVNSLRRLGGLYLSNNRLSTLPAGISSLVELSRLTLSGNQFSILPMEVGNLPKLSYLTLGENPWQTFPPGSTMQDRMAILAYLQTSQRAKEERSETKRIQVEEKKTIPPGESNLNRDSLSGNVPIKEISREKDQTGTKETLPLKIFYCYAHEDKDLRERIDRHLGTLKRLGQIVGWYDREIQAGTEWEREITGNLGTAHIILLLISADFIFSDYCYGVEMQKALEMHEKGEAHVLPILLRPVDWQDAPFAKLQMLPTGAIPITEWSNQDKALEDVAKQIRAVVTALRT